MRAIVSPFRFFVVSLLRRCRFVAVLGVCVCVCVLLLAPQESNVSRDVVRWHALLLHCWASSSPPSIDSLLGNSTWCAEACPWRRSVPAGLHILVPPVSLCVGLRGWVFRRCRFPFRLFRHASRHGAHSMFVFFGFIGPPMGASTGCFSHGSVSGWCGLV